MQRPDYSYRDDLAVPAFPDDRGVVVFDGECALCSASARTVLRRDRHGTFRVLSAQSLLGLALYRHYGLTDGDLSTFILIQDGRARFKSDAVIDIARQLGGAGRLAVVLRLVPRRLRDAAYDWVARNRLRLTRGHPVCRLVPGLDPDRVLG